jgi:hypothetical protein
MSKNTRKKNGIKYFNFFIFTLKNTNTKNLNALTHLFIFMIFFDFYL